LTIEFKLIDEESKDLLARGNQAIFDNRVCWAKTYLKKQEYLALP
jgi:restriction system protein